MNNSASKDFAALISIEIVPVPSSTGWFPCWTSEKVYWQHYLYCSLSRSSTRGKTEVGVNLTL
jgi:hypothetical protein